MAEFRIDPPAAAGATPTAVSDDLLAQLGQRAFSIRQESDGWHFTGDVTEAEVTTALAGYAGRKQQAAQAEAARLAELTQDRGDLPALLTALVANRDALLDTTQAFSIAQLRPIIARSITLELLIVRELRRRGL